jgi:hypothetical protein
MWLDGYKMMRVGEIWRDPWMVAPGSKGLARSWGAAGANLSTFVWMWRRCRGSGRRRVRGSAPRWSPATGFAKSPSSELRKIQRDDWAWVTWTPTPASGCLGPTRHPTGWLPKLRHSFRWGGWLIIEEFLLIKPTHSLVNNWLIFLLKRRRFSTPLEISTFFGGFASKLIRRYGYPKAIQQRGIDMRSGLHNGVGVHLRSVRLV